MKIIFIFLLAISSFESYSQWTTRTPAPSTSCQGPAVCSLNGFVYLIGGSNGSGTYFTTNQRYDPAANTWVTLTAMPTARAYAAAVAASNGKIYVFGGSTASALNVVQEYDPGTNTWATKTAMPTSRMGLGAAEYNGKIYVIGGWNGSAVVNTCAEYDFTTNTWAAKTAMPTSRYQLGCAQSGGLIYAVGGWTTAPSNIVQAYDPVSDTWTAKANMNGVRYLHGVAVLSGKIWAIGGWNGANSGATEYYTPSTNSWTNYTVMNQPRYQIGAAATAACVYSLAGNTGGGPVGTIEEACPSVLPVELLSFFGRNEEHKNILRWETASEINNDYFDVQRSSDGKIWNQIGTVKGAGNSSSPLSYTFIDNSELSVLNSQLTYYRLKQTDYDGKFEYFGPVSITYSVDDEVQIFPTLNKGQFTIADVHAPTELSIYDVNGNRLMEHFVNKNMETVNTDLPSGMYLVQMKTETKTISKKIIITK